MTQKKSPFGNPETIPARTQETLFNVPQERDNTTVDANVSKNHDDAAIAKQEPIRTVLVPAGSDVIIYSKSFAPALLNEVDTLVASIEALKPVTSQADVEAQNTVLKNASRLMTKIETERKAMNAPLKDVSDELMQMQKNTLYELSELVNDKNKEIVNFQKEEDRKAREKAAEIQKQKDAEILAAKNEATRKQNILNLIQQFETSTLNAINSATIDNIDERINMYSGFKVKEETYQEFMPQILALQKDLQFKFMYRKEDLYKIAELEKTNKLQADQLKLQADQKAQADKEAAAQRIAEQQATVEEQAQSDIANTVMQSEFKTAQMPVAKNVMRKWGFDPENVNMAALPLEYHTFDKAKIDAAIAAGARSIPGIVIEQRISNVKK